MRATNAPSSSKFKELLAKVAAEHEREVKQLNDDVKRLRALAARRNEGVRDKNSDGEDKNITTRKQLQTQRSGSCSTLQSSILEEEEEDEHRVMPATPRVPLVRNSCRNSAFMVSASTPSSEDSVAASCQLAGSSNRTYGAAAASNQANAPLGAPDVELTDSTNHDLGEECAAQPPSPTNLIRIYDTELAEEPCAQRLSATALPQIGSAPLDEEPVEDALLMMKRVGPCSLNITFSGLSGKSLEVPDETSSRGIYDGESRIASVVGDDTIEALRIDRLSKRDTMQNSPTHKNMSPMERWKCLIDVANNNTALLAQTWRQEEALSATFSDKRSRHAMLGEGDASDNLRLSGNSRHSVSLWPSARQTRTSVVMVGARLRSRFSQLPFVLVHGCRGISPNSKWRTLWDLLGIIHLCWDILMTPLSVFDNGTGGLDEGYKRLATNFNLAGTIFWTCDIGVSFFTGYYSAEGFVETRLRKASAHYLRTWFSLDFLIVVLDWAGLVLGMGSEVGYLRLGKTASRFMRITRLLRFMKLNLFLQKLNEKINSEYLLTFISLLKLVVMIVVMNHYIACGFYLISYLQKDTEETWTYKFLKLRDLCPSAAATEAPPDPKLGWAYLTSLHWSLTQFTPASMEVVPMNELERMYTIIVIIAAMVTFSSFVSSITNSMTHLRHINARKSEQDTQIRTYFSQNSISQDLASRIWHFRRRNVVATGRRLREQDIYALKALPPTIIEDLRCEVHAPVLCNHPFFIRYSSLDAECIKELCYKAVHERMLGAGEEYLDITHPVKEMVFVTYGCVAYRCVELEVAPIIRSKNWFFEVVLWSSRAHISGSIIAGDDSAEILTLESRAFQVIAKKHYDSMNFVVHYAILFVKRFNAVAMDVSKNSVEDILFNSFEVVDQLAGLCYHEYTSSRRDSTVVADKEAIIRTFVMEAYRVSR